MGTLPCDESSPPDDSSGLSVGDGVVDSLAGSLAGSVAAGESVTVTVVEGVGSSLSPRVTERVGLGTDTLPVG